MESFNLSTVIMLTTLIVYNVAIIKILSYALPKINISEALSEKSLPSAPPSANLPGLSTGETSSERDVTSYSRVSGFIGSIVLAVFFWSVGNIVLYKAFSSVTDVNNLISGLSIYFILGAVLFVPYALNQIKSMFS